jgi:hypothetical protein
MSQKQSQQPPDPPADIGVGGPGDPGAIVQAAVAQSEAMRIQGEVASASYADAGKPQTLRDLSPFGR